MKSALLFALLLVACGTPKQWAKPGGSYDDFITDRGECQARAYSVSGPPLQQAIVFKGCLEGKGWRLE